MIKLRSLQRKLRRLANKACLEHERHGVAYIARLQLCLARLLKCFCVWPMARHAIVQAGAARDEAFRLCVIFAVDQPHELVHKIAVKPRRTKRMLRYHPSRRKDRKVDIRGSRNVDFADRKSTRLNSSHQIISYAVFCLKKKKIPGGINHTPNP